MFTSNRNRLLVLAAALVYLLSQTADLQHSHNGDLNLQSDCQICLKLGTQNDATLAQVNVPDVSFDETVYQTILPRLVVQSLLAPRTRAPPVLPV